MASTAIAPVEASARRTSGGDALALAVWPLEHGFETPDLTVIGEQDILGDRLIRAAPRRARQPMS